MQMHNIRSSAAYILHMEKNEIITMGICFTHNRFCCLFFFLPAYSPSTISSIRHYAILVCVVSFPALCYVSPFRFFLSHSPPFLLPILAGWISLDRSCVPHRPCQLQAKNRTKKVRGIGLNNETACMRRTPHTHTHCWRTKPANYAAFFMHSLHEDYHCVVHSTKHMWLLWTLAGMWATGIAVRRNSWLSMRRTVFQVQIKPFLSVGRNWDASF